MSKKNRKLFGDNATATLGNGRIPAVTDPFARFERDDEPSGVSLMLSCPAAYHAIDLISNMIAKNKVHAYKRTEKGKEVDEDHWVEYLLNQNANPFTDSMDFLQCLVANTLWSGNGFAWIERNEMGDPIALYNIDPKQMDMAWDFDDAKLTAVYYVLRVDGNVTPLLFDDVIHIKNTTMNNGMFGVPVLAQLGGTFRHANDLAQYSSKYFKNGSHINKYIQVPNWMTEEQKAEFAANIEQQKTGVNNAHKLLVLQGGMQMGSLQLSNDEAQFIESKNLSDAQIATVFGLFGSKVNVAVGTSANSLQEQELQLLQEVYGKYMRKIEVAINTKCYRETERKKRFVEFLREDLLSMDQKAKYEMAIALKNNGIYTDVETRLMLNMCKPEFAEGQFSSPANLIDPYAPPKPEPQPTAPQDQPPEAQPPVDAPKDQPTVAEMANGVVERWKTRIIRSTNHDLSKHVDVLLENLTGFNRDKILDAVAELDKSIQENPDNRKGIIEQWNLAV